MGILYVIAIVIVAVILLYVAFWIMSQFPLGDPLDKIIRVLLILIAVAILCWAILAIFGVVPGPRFAERYGALLPTLI